MRYIIIFATIFGVFVESQAEETVITKDGKTVLLKDDGTWNYIETTKTDGGDFRDASWGQSAKEIKTGEKWELVEEKPNLIGYKGKLLGLDAFAVYIFVDNRLVRAKYVIYEEHSNKTDYISDYKNLVTKLKEKYGPATKDKQIWKKDLYKDDSQHWGTAISMGHLVYFTEWSNGRTEISAYLYGDNFKIQFAVEYKSIELEGLEKKQESQKSMDDL